MTRSSVSKAVASDSRQLERRGELDVPCTAHPWSFFWCLHGGVCKSVSLCLSPSMPTRDMAWLPPRRDMRRENHSKVFAGGGELRLGEEPAVEAGPADGEDVPRATARALHQLRGRWASPAACTGVGQLPCGSRLRGGSLSLWHQNKSRPVPVLHFKKCWQVGSPFCLYHVTNAHPRCLWAPVGIQQQCGGCFIHWEVCSHLLMLRSLCQPHSVKNVCFYELFLPVFRVRLLFPRVVPAGFALLPGHTLLGGCHPPVCV